MLRAPGGVCLLCVCLLAICSCEANIAGRLSYAPATTDPLAVYDLIGNTTPVLDPSIIRQDLTYYAFSTDVDGSSNYGHLPIRCSQDKIHWTVCSSVFPSAIPGWIQERVPGITGLWAPDVSYFGGEYHVYYCGSTLKSQRSVIGLATNVTLDPNDADYKWIDRGLVLESKKGDDFNALDPAILVDSDDSVWITYGSYWTGIKQRQIDRATGLLLASDLIRYDLATRPSVPHNPIEGASLVRHGAYYYLFVSVDHCCESTVGEDNYKQAVGRSSSPHGPFVDEDGTPMMNGGGTVLLQGKHGWNAPGGGTAYLDPESGESLIIFHAQNLAENATPTQWVKKLEWMGGWPVISN